MIPQTESRPGFFRELRRRRVFRLAGLYIVGAWVVIEVSSVFFPAWGIPDSALRYLFIGAAVLFPIALVFSWIYDVTPRGIVRTEAADSGAGIDIALQKKDYGILAALALITILVIYDSIERVAVETAENPVIDQAERIPDSIAVLPFKNLDPREDSQFFSDGVTEEILHKISSLRRLHVLASTSSFAFRNSEETTEEISAKLRVEYLLKGSVRRDGEMVRVSTQLLDRMGTVLWSQSFDRKLESILVVQAEIARTVAARIRDEVVSSGSVPLAKATIVPAAYDEYLIGRQYTRTRTEDWKNKAADAFRRSIELDPEFAPAYAGLAYAITIWGGEEGREEALPIVERALELDPNLAEAHAVYGTMLDDPVAAEQSYRRAIELDPSYPESYSWMAIALNRQRRDDESVEAMEQGYAIDGLNPILNANLSSHYARSGEFERAERMKLRLTRVPQPSPIAELSLWNLYHDWGRYALAYDRVGDSPIRLGETYAALGMFDEAKTDLEMLVEENRFHWIRPGWDIFQAQGRNEEAWDKQITVMNELGISFDNLDLTETAIIIGKLIFAGRYEEATSLYETKVDVPPQELIYYAETGIATEALLSLVFAYRQLGDPTFSEQILNALNASWIGTEDIATPIFLETKALLYVQNGNVDAAYSSLSRAVDLGWADYYFAINDPRWGDTLSEPRFVELLARVQANLEQQRAEVRAKEAGSE